MAITAPELAVSLRLSADGTDVPQAQTDIRSDNRLLSVAEAHIDLLAPTAPEIVRDEAAILFASYLYEVPTSGRRDAYANAFVFSGAGAMLVHWTDRRAAGSTSATAI